MSDDLNWVQVGDLARGITQYSLSDSEALAGKALALHFAGGESCRLRFADGHTLAWELDGQGEPGGSGTEWYRATSPREAIYLVDYLPRDRHATCVSLVLDLASGMATRVVGRLPSREQAGRDFFSRASAGMDLTAVAVGIESAAIDRPWDAVSQRRHEPTAELVGRRIQYVYSASEVYEHIYLNEKLYTWHCLAGIERGLADTDRCQYLKIADRLYLFVWREKVVPTLGVVLIDLMAMKTTGKLFGYEGSDFQKLTNAPIGAYASVLNETRHVLP
jgi:hypothetical protein